MKPAVQESEKQKYPVCQGTIHILIHPAVLIFQWHTFLNSEFEIVEIFTCT